MTPYAFRSLIRRAAAVLVALLVAAGTIVVGAQSAAAHDQLVQTDPADGSTLDVLPTQISLTFSADPLDEAGATVVQVTDAAGVVLNDGDTMQDGAVITQQLTPGATGLISVVWRVASSDGHPVSGEFSFTVTGTATASATPTPTASATAAPTVTESASPPPSGDAGAAALPWIIGAVVLVAVVAVIVLLAARARQQRRANEERTAGRDDSAGR